MKTVTQKRAQDRYRGYVYLTCLTLLLFLLAFYFDSPAAIFSGLGRILLSPSQLVTDYFAVGGVGATLVNVAIMLLLAVLSAYLNRAPVTGVLLASFGTVAGFSFFGKHLLNSLPIMLGVYLYAKVIGHPYKNHLVVSLFGTTLAPAVSFVALGTDLPLVISLPLAFMTGLFIGFVLPPLSAQFLSFHQGFSLYNIGFTAGLVAMILSAFFHVFGLEVEVQSILYQGDEGALYLLLYSLSAILLVTSLFLARKEPLQYRQLLRSSGRLPSDFLAKTNLATVSLNIGLLGLLATIFLQVFAQQLTGPLIGGGLTLMGFGAFGKHPRNVFPIVLGVLLAAANSNQNQNHSVLLTALFATSLAPIAGYYGWIAGLVAGFIHMLLVARVVGLHEGLNLYNNGFSAGFIAALFVPIFDSFEHIKTARIDRKKLKKSSG